MDTKELEIGQEVQMCNGRYGPFWGEIVKFTPNGIEVRMEKPSLGDIRYFNPEGIECAPPKFLNCVGDCRDIGALEIVGTMDWTKELTVGDWIPLGKVIEITSDRIRVQICAAPPYHLAHLPNEVNRYPWTRDFNKAGNEIHPLEFPNAMLGNGNAWDDGSPYKIARWWIGRKCECGRRW